MKKTLFLVVVFATMNLLSLGAREYGVKDVPNVQLQDSALLLSNPDSIVAEKEAAEINRLLIDIRRKATAEVVAVVVGDFDGDDVDEFATELFKAWGIGKKGKDNGILLFVAKDRRKLTIRTGYGAEGVMPDIICGHIIRDFITRPFKDGKYGEGILAGVKEIHRLVTNPAAADELREQLKQNADDGDGWMYALLFFGIIGLLIWALMKFSSKGGSGTSGGGTSAKTSPRVPTSRTSSRSSSGSNRGGHFGGGSTGGGGASGGW